MYIVGNYLILDGITFSVNDSIGKVFKHNREKLELETQNIKDSKKHYLFSGKLNSSSLLFHLKKLENFGPKSYSFGRVKATEQL